MPPPLQARVPVSEFEFPPSKLANVQPQLEKLVAKNYYLHKSARDAYRSYLHAYNSHSLKASDPPHPHPRTASPPLHIHTLFGRPHIISRHLASSPARTCTRLARSICSASPSLSASNTRPRSH